jgi:hypothetical protein
MESHCPVYEGACYVLDFVADQHDDSPVRIGWTDIGPGGETAAANDESSAARQEPPPQETDQKQQQQQQQQQQSPAEEEPSTPSDLDDVVQQLPPQQQQQQQQQQQPLSSLPQDHAQNELRKACSPLLTRDQLKDCVQLCAPATCCYVPTGSSASCQGLEQRSVDCDWYHPCDVLYGL